LPLGTANVVRQYLRSGFTSEAKAWAHEHVPSSDERGEVTQALSELHSHRLSEQGKLEAILKFESKHRLALANFVVAGLSSEAQNIQGRYRFPAFSLELTRLANSLTGTGETGSLSAKWTYRLTAHFEHRLWRFQIDSESIYSQNKSEGILAFSADGKKGMVLEYQPDGVIAHYMIFQELGNQTILAPSS